MAKNIVAVYCRTNGEDLSIVERNIEICKRNLSEKYNKKIDDIVYYIDINSNGVNNYRPAFEKLKEDIKQNKINFCITISINQLSRDSFGLYELKDILKKNKCNLFAIKENCILDNDLLDLSPENLEI